MGHKGLCFAKGLMKSSRHLRNLYKKKHGLLITLVMLNMSDIETYNEIKSFCKGKLFRENTELHYKHDAKNTWKTLHPLINCQNRDKTCITPEVLINEEYVSEPTAVTNE